jgi:flagellar hook-associated protein 1 FlgK
MDDLYKSLDEMSKNPGDIAFREPVRENAMAFTKHINETAKRLENMKTETENSIETKVKYVNTLSSQIAALNKQIHSAEIDGRHANDLRDRRELLVDDLSKIVNVKVNEGADGKYNVSVGGISIVDHMDVNKMSFNKDAVDVNKMITWENGGTVNIKSGEIKGLTDMLTGDGKNGTYKGIPYFENQLNEFAKGYADKFNEQHRKGYTLDGDQNINFFTYELDNPAATFTLDKAILDDIRKIAAGGSSGDQEDNENLLALIKQREDKTFFKDGVSQGTPDDFIKSMLSSMAVDSMQAKKVYETQGLIQNNIITKRNSISGVSLEEEMADMVRFQHVYVASSKMITTMDTLLDITVNRLGLVGR